MSAYVHDTQFFTRRTIVFFVIVSLHVLILWALATGLATKAIQMVAPPLKTTIVQQTQKHVQPPPPPPPQLQQQQVQVPPPIIQINVPAASESHAITVTRHVVRSAPVSVARLTALSPITHDFPAPDSFYPDASRRLGEEGTAQVKLCIGAGGRLTQPPIIIRSSGSPRLDRAAIKYGEATSGHFHPATRNGVPVTVCTVLPIKFQLQSDF